jgi:hypothetical protein
LAHVAASRRFESHSSYPDFPTEAMRSVSREADSPRPGENGVTSKTRFCVFRFQ